MKGINKKVMSKIIKKVKCITGEYFFMERGSVFDVIGESDIDYLIIFDNGETEYFPKRDFKVVEDYTEVIKEPTTLITPVESLKQVKQTKKDRKEAIKDIKDNFDKIIVEMLHQSYEVENFKKDYNTRDDNKVLRVENFETLEGSEFIKVTAINYKQDHTTISFGDIDETIHALQGIIKDLQIHQWQRGNKGI